MGFFKNAATEWGKTMTENDLDQMEDKGLYVSAYQGKNWPSVTSKSKKKSNGTVKRVPYEFL